MRPRLHPESLLGAALPPKARTRFAARPLARRLALLELRDRTGLGAKRLARRTRHDLPREVRHAFEWTGAPARPVEPSALEPERCERVADLLLRTCLTSYRAPEGQFLDFRLDGLACAPGRPELRWTPATAWYRCGEGFRATWLALYADAVGASYDGPSSGSLFTSETTGARQREASRAFARDLVALHATAGSVGALRHTFDRLLAGPGTPRPDLAVTAIALAGLQYALGSLGARPDVAALFREVYP